VPAQQIVALSFTNKAADEMRRRVTELVGPQPVEMGTFHRFAAGSSAGMPASWASRATTQSSIPTRPAPVLKRAAKRLGLALSHTPIDRIAGTISRAKNDLLTPETFEPPVGAARGRGREEVVAGLSGDAARIEFR